jgi:hypothetical protein
MSCKPVIEIARKFCGLYETKPNAEWSSKTLQNPSALSDELIAMMKTTGWEPGWAYCAAFADACFREAYKDDDLKLATIKKILSPSVMTTYAAGKKYFSKVPTPGSIFILQHGQGGTGHAGIVGENITTTSFETFEANTSPSAAMSVEADRNGDCITNKSRSLNFTPGPNLHLLGFIDLNFDKA